MSNEGDYVGRHFEEESDGHASPPMPDGPQQDMDAARGGTGTYARVRFTGRYGALCSQFQTFEKSRITLPEAREIAWDRFGVCSKKITCFDEQGNVVHEE